MNVRDLDFENVYKYICPDRLVICMCSRKAHFCYFEHAWIINNCGVVCCCRREDRGVQTVGVAWLAGWVGQVKMTRFIVHFQRLGGSLAVAAVFTTLLLCAYLYHSNWVGWGEGGGMWGNFTLKIFPH